MRRSSLQLCWVYKIRHVVSVVRKQMPLQQIKDNFPNMVLVKMQFFQIGGKFPLCSMDNLLMFFEVKKKKKKKDNKCYVLKK